MSAAPSRQAEPPERKHVHRCPVCGAPHEVKPVRAEMAYGRQLSCSPDCEAERRRRLRAPYRVVSGPIAG
jgi:hypothetical protein